MLAFNDPVFGFLAKNFLDFIDFLPRSWKLFPTRHVKFCKIFQDRGKKSYKIYKFLGEKSKIIQDIAKKIKIIPPLFDFIGEFSSQFGMFYTLFEKICKMNKLQQKLQDVCA